MTTRLPILDEDGWTLYDGEERNRVNPDTFEVPDKEARENLKKGEIVKLMFCFLNPKDEKSGPTVERMWVSVKGKKEEFYWGQLDNDPTTTDLIKAGDDIFFLPQHVISIY